MKNLLALSVCAVLVSGPASASTAEAKPADAAKPAAKKAAAAAPKPDAKTPAAKQEAKPMPPLPENAKEKAPETFKARFKTTKGEFVISATRAWAPNGADRFYNLVRLGYFTDIAFFRAIDGFMVQFGINGDPSLSAKWRGANIPDDQAAGHTNARGAVTFATAGPGTRTTQLFINFGNNGSLDSMGFTPFGSVVTGMEVVDSLYKGYGEGAPRGMGPDQGRVQQEGNAYLKKDFPKLDYIKSAALEK